MEIVANVRIGEKYQALRKVGEGAFAEVWLGQDITTGALVALKRLRRSRASDAEVVARFRREAYFLSRVRSDHVAKISELVVDPMLGMVLVMEFIEGHLLSFLMQRTLLSVEESIDLAVDLLCGVRDLHMARIIHRDLKPSNVILRPMGDQFRAVIFDFSLSRLSERVPEDEGESSADWRELTLGGTTLGTLQYMAPEQILNSREVTDRSDIYSVGAILYTAVCGEHPFAEFEDQQRDLARAKLNNEAPPLATGRADELARSFEAIVGKALARRPQERYSTATGMLEALDRLRALHGEWSEADGRGRRAAPGSMQTQAVRRASSDQLSAVRPPRSRGSLSQLAAAESRRPVPAAPPSSASMLSPAQRAAALSASRMAAAARASNPGFTPPTSPTSSIPPSMPPISSIPPSSIPPSSSLPPSVPPSSSVPPGKPPEPVTVRTAETTPQVSRAPRTQLEATVNHRRVARRSTLVLLAIAAGLAAGGIGIAARVAWSRWSASHASTPGRTPRGALKPDASTGPGTAPLH